MELSVRECEGRETGKGKQPAIVVGVDLQVEFEVREMWQWIHMRKKKNSDERIQYEINESLLFHNIQDCIQWVMGSRCYADQPFPSQPRGDGSWRLKVFAPMRCWRM